MARLYHTKSALLLGTVGFASQIPVFLFAPIGGIVADRVNRQRLVIATQIASMILAGILAWLTIFHYIQVWHIFVLAPCSECQRIRYSRTSVLPHRHGRQGRPDERLRIEFFNV